MTSMHGVLFVCCGKEFACFVQDENALIKCPVCGLTCRASVADIGGAHDGDRWWRAYLRHRYWHWTHRRKPTRTVARESRAPKTSIRGPPPP